MQSLPTPIMQTKTLNLSDMANKNGSPITKPSAESTKTVFQNELNKQVKAKQAQPQPKPDNKSKADDTKKATQESSVVKDASDSDEVTQADKAVSNIPLEASFLADLGKQIDAARDMVNQPGLASEAKSQLSVSVSSDVSSSLIASLGAAAVPTLQNLVSGGQGSVGIDASGAMLDSTSVMMEQNGLMTPFNNLTEINAQAQQFIGNTSVKAQGEGLENALTSKPEIKAVADDAVLGKAVANVAKEFAAKELSVKEPLVKNEMNVPVQLQAANAAPAQTNNNIAAQQLASANVINVSPGKTGWDQAISQKVVWMVGAGQQSASLTLNPPDLGPLKVVINVHNDQADTTFISDNDEVRKALESGMAHLREKMSESGIQLGQANVSTNQQSQQEFQHAAQARGFNGIKNQTSTNLVENESHAKVSVRVSNGLVDTFA